MAILTPYVGQLLRLREEVSQFMVCTLDERDADQLADLQVGRFLRFSFELLVNAQDQLSNSVGTLA